MMNNGAKRAKDSSDGPLGSRNVTIREPEQILTAAETLRDFALDLGGFRVAACANIASKSPMQDAVGNILASHVFGWPTTKNQWWRKPQLALNSPLPIACRYESEPFWANIYGFYPKVENPMLASIDLTDFEELVQASAVICIPVYQPFGQIGVVSFSRIGNDRIDLAREFELYSDRLEQVSRRFINSYSRMTYGRPRIPQNCRLTDREIVCLRWAAVGKTDGEIAQIIHRSCATVRFHIQKARGKLDAVNRSQTVFKASQLGYLGSTAVTKTLVF